MRYKLSPRSLDIRLSNGLYYFEINSAIGKTYLYKLLEQLNKY